MNYDSTKLKFEQIVSRMQADLAEYANKKTSSPASIDYRLQQINDLVDFYTMATDLISEEQMKNMEVQLGYMRLHSDTQKLVLFAKLHRINPNMIFNYTLEELQQMYSDGVRLQPPVKSLSRMMVLANGSGGYEINYKEDSLEDITKVAKHEQKYYNLQAAAVRC